MEMLPKGNSRILILFGFLWNRLFQRFESELKETLCFFNPKLINFNKVETRSRTFLPSFIYHLLLAYMDYQFPNCWYAEHRWLKGWQIRIPMMWLITRKISNLLFMQQYCQWSIFRENTAFDKMIIFRDM